MRINDVVTRKIKSSNSSVVFEDQEANKITSAVIDFYKHDVGPIQPEPVEDYTKQANELLHKAEPGIRDRVREILVKAKTNPYLQGGIITTVGALLTGGLLTTASQMHLSPAQTNILLQAVLNTVIPTVVSRVNGKNWIDTIKYTLASAGIGTGIALVSEDDSGINFDMQFDDDTGTFATVTARAHGRTLGSVEFFIDGDTLEADMVEVDERYRGQGIAAAMYDYAKSQGYTIEKSDDLTPDGEHFWNKNRGEETVWEAELIEAFDQPYAIEWTKTNGDWHATADLDDGSELVVLFMSQGDNQWMVEFERDENMEITGEGDAPRVFATVLTAMRQFIAKRKPAMLNFSAEKEDDPTGSRARLYDRMVQRYITGTGYNLTRQDYPGGATYTLTQIQKPVKQPKQEPAVAEDQINELGNAPADYKANRKRKNSLFHATVEGHWVDVFFDRSEFNGTLHITFTVNGDYDAPSQPTSASKSTVKILSTVLNVIKQKLPEYIKKSRPPGISFTSKQDNRTSLYRKYFVPVIQDILGAKWQHEEYPNMGMTVFHWRPVRKSLGESLNEIDDIKHVARKLVQLADRHLHFETQPRIHFTDSISHPTFGYFEPESNSIHIAHADRHVMDTMRTLAHELVHHRQRETKGQLDGSTASGDENQANSVAGAIMRDFAQRHPEYFHDDQINEISDELVQRYLGRADRQISRRLDRMSQARERLNKNYEIYDVNNPTRIIDRFEANTPAQAEEYYYKFIKGYNPGDENFEFGLRRSTGIPESVTEAFDQPYAVQWEKGDYGDWDATAKLSDGTNLNIMFDQAIKHPGVWTVNFYRNNSLDVTGEGDAHRVFATVLTAIQEFTEWMTPNRIVFTSEKTEDSDNTSRSKLYDRLVQRYAASAGFAFTKREEQEQTIYILTRPEQQK